MEPVAMTIRAPVPLLLALLLSLLLASALPAAAPPDFFTPVLFAADGPHGYLARATPQKDARDSDPRVAALRAKLDALTSEGKSPAEAVPAWQSLAGEPFATASGRTGLRPPKPEDAPAPAGSAWAACCRRLLFATGESRFADALETARYAGAPAAFSSSAPPSPVDDALLRFRNGESDGLALNLFESGSATVPLDGQQVTVHVLSRFPREGEIQVQFRMAAPARFAVWVRVPAWAPELTVRSLAANTEWIGLPGDWARLPVRAWAGSDWLEISMSLQSKPLQAKPPQAKPLHTKPFSGKRIQWGPMRLDHDPAGDTTLLAKLDPGTPVTQALDHYAFPLPVARPSRPPHPSAPLPPGKTLIPEPDRRGWYTWLRWNPDTWEATVGSDPPGQTWNVRVLPYAVTIRDLVFGASPDDLLPGERVNIFLGPGTDGEWSVLNYFQDELTQMQGHHHWWWVRTVASSGRKFTARLFTQGDNLLQWPEESFELAPDCEFWRDGARARRFPLQPRMPLRMLSVYRGSQRVVKLLTDDAGLEALKKQKLESERARIRDVGMAGFVDSVDRDTAHLTLFSTYWPYGHELKAGQAVTVVATGPGYRPAGTRVPAQIVSAHVTGMYGSGDTEVVLRGAIGALRGWTGGKVIRLIAGSNP